MWGSYEGHYNVFLFTHEARRKNTERLDMSYRMCVSDVRFIQKGIAINDNSYPKLG